MRTGFDCARVTRECANGKRLRDSVREGSAATARSTMHMRSQLCCALLFRVLAATGPTSRLRSHSRCPDSERCFQRLALNCSVLGRWCWHQSGRIDEARRARWTRTVALRWQSSRRCYRPRFEAICATQGAMIPRRSNVSPSLRSSVRNRGCGSPRHGVPCDSRAAWLCLMRGSQASDRLAALCPSRRRRGPGARDRPADRRR